MLGVPYGIYIVYFQFCSVYLRCMLDVIVVADDVKFRFFVTLILTLTLTFRIGSYLRASLIDL